MNSGMIFAIIVAILIAVVAGIFVALRNKNK